MSFKLSIFRWFHFYGIPGQNRVKIFIIYQLYNEEVPEYEILLSPSYSGNPINEDTEDSLYFDQIPVQYPDYYQDLSKDALESFYDSLDGKVHTFFQESRSIWLF